MGNGQRGPRKFLRCSPSLGDRTGVPWLKAGLELTPRWGCSETGNPLCWGPRSWHWRLPMGGSRARAGSNDVLEYSDGERGRKRIVQGGKVRRGKAYLYCHLGDGQRCPWGRVPSQFPGNRRAARGRNLCGGCLLGRGFLPGGDKLSGLRRSLAAAPDRGAADTICLRFPINHRWER